MPKLIKVVKSTDPKKKLEAHFETHSGRTKITRFGASGMDDYTLTKNREQRDRYRKRHQKDLATKDPTKAGYLSYYILWGDSTSRSQNISAYKKKFNL
jgi:hypothetical protein